MLSQTAELGQLRRRVHHELAGRSLPDETERRKARSHRLTWEEVHCPLAERLRNGDSGGDCEEVCVRKTLSMALLAGVGGLPADRTCSG